MPINLVRVVNEQNLPTGLSRDGSILLDKIDRSSGHSENPPYAQIAKQKVYVPKWNPLDPTVKGYTDLVPTDEVVLSSLPDGSIGGQVTAGNITVSIVASNLIVTPTVTAASNAATDTTITGTTFLSVLPDLTKVTLTNLAGASQVIPASNFTTHTATSIVIPDADVSIGTPTTGWTVKVFSNSTVSNTFTLT
jgi:hypothetical protein